jgi:hypothetical protein
MIQVLALGLSVLILAVSYLKSREKREEKPWFESNMELEKYYDMQTDDVAPNTLQKQLLTAAVVVSERAYLISQERQVLYGLYNDRIVSYKLWERLDKAKRDLEFETMGIEAEADTLKSKWGDRIFQESEQIVYNNARTKDKGKRERKNKDDLFFEKKREMLEREVVKKLKL